jgi:hypothetical protein
MLLLLTLGCYYLPWVTIIHLVLHVVHLHHVLLFILNCYYLPWVDVVCCCSPYVVVVVLLLVQVLTSPSLVLLLFALCCYYLLGCFIPSPPPPPPLLLPCTSWNLDHLEPKCHNPNLGLASKARVRKNVSQKRSMGVWESVRINTHIPK